MASSLSLVINHITNVAQFNNNVLQQFSDIINFSLTILETNGSPFLQHEEY